MAWNETSDSSTWKAGEGCTGLWPTEARKLPITAIAGLKKVGLTAGAAAGSGAGVGSGAGAGVATGAGVGTGVATGSGVGEGVGVGAGASCAWTPSAHASPPA